MSGCPAEGMSPLHGTFWGKCLSEPLSLAVPGVRGLQVHPQLTPSLWHPTDPAPCVSCTPCILYTPSTLHPPAAAAQPSPPQENRAAAGGAAPPDPRSRGAPILGTPRSRRGAEAAVNHPWDTQLSCCPQRGQRDPFSRVACLPNWMILLLFFSSISQPL